MKPSWIVGWALNPMTNVFKRERQRFETHGRSLWEERDRDWRSAVRAKE